MAYWFEVAVDDSVTLQQLQALQEGVGKAANESDAETLEAVLLDQLIQVHAGREGVKVESKRVKSERYNCYRKIKGVKVENCRPKQSLKTEWEARVSLGLKHKYQRPK